MATPGKRQKTSAGKVLKNAISKVVAFRTGDENCCCAGGCGDCASISDLSVTFASIVKCTCFDTGAGYYASLIDDPNNTYTGFTKIAALTGYDCAFSKTVSLTSKTYTAAGCAVVDGTSTTAAILVQHNASTNKWETTFTIVDPNTIDFYVFAGRATDGFDVASTTATSDLTVCANNTVAWLGGGIGAYAHGGTALVEFICGA